MIRRIKSKSQRVRAVSPWTQWCPERRGWVTPGRLSFVESINILDLWYIREVDPTFPLDLPYVSVTPISYPRAGSDIKIHEVFVCVFFLIVIHSFAPIPIPRIFGHKIVWYQCATFLPWPKYQLPILKLLFLRQFLLIPKPRPYNDWQKSRNQDVKLCPQNPLNLQQNSQEKQAASRRADTEWQRRVEYSISGKWDYVCSDFYIVIGLAWIFVENGIFFFLTSLGTKKLFFF